MSQESDSTMRRPQSVVQHQTCLPAEGAKQPFIVKEFRDSSAKQSVRYYFVDREQHGPVWNNVLLFLFLHLVYLFGLIHLFRARLWYSWMFGFWYSMLGGIGVTCGVHRLWSHRSYKASFPLKAFLMICQSIAGQNDVYTWCRDHRLHHKYSETDADPHNSNRGFFFCHVGWLLTRKHPEVWIKGKGIDCSDLLTDPVLAFQRKYYSIFYVLFCFLLPTLCCHYVIGDNWLDSWLVGSFGRYIVSLHCTWFVNSAAHMFGHRPYNARVQPRDNEWVSWATWGEGFHNYHHVFPYDYAISETGLKLDPMRAFIDVMAFLGLAYDLKRVPKDTVRQVKYRTALSQLTETNFHLR